LNGINTAAIVNHSMGAPRKPARPLDFMPSYHSRARKTERRRMTRKQVERECRGIFDALRATQAAKGE
jgi:hypothetical protein